jgi:hypothetical protein
MVSNRKRRQGSSWTVAPAEEAQVEEEEEEEEEEVVYISNARRNPLMATYIQHICKVLLCNVGFSFLRWPVVAETCRGNHLYYHIKFVALDGSYCVTVHM